MSETAILVGLESLDELRELTTAAGGRVLAEFIQHRDRPDSAYFVGKGKASEIRDEVLQLKADLVVFDDELSPSQVRNLERVLETKVIDRTGLILDIFSRRAQTREGKLQVELAPVELSYLPFDGSRGNCCPGWVEVSGHEGLAKPSSKWIVAEFGAESPA